MLRRTGLVVLTCVLASSVAVAPSFAVARESPARPTVSHVHPAVGSTKGGTSVLLTGSGFRHVRRVMFGSTRARHLTVASSHRLRVTAPAHRTATVELRVVTRQGESVARRFRYVRFPIVTTATLPHGVARAPYRAVLAASGGAEPYRWRATGLPKGVTLDGAGRFGGNPAATGTHAVRVAVTDAAGRTTHRTLTFTVASALPADCADGSCAHFVPGPNTVDEPAADVLTVDRDTSGAPTQVVLRGTPPSVGQILVIPPVADAPSGLLAEVDAVTTNGDGTTTAAVQRRNPGEAFDHGDAVRSAASATESGGALRRMRMHPDDFVTCSTPNVDVQVNKLQVLPQLKPTLALDFDLVHGVTLFQVGIEGSLKIHVDMSVSAKTTCSLNLPSFRTTIPVGELGVVVLELVPSVKLDLSGRFSFSTGVTLGCGAFYSYVKGKSSSSSYCGNTAEPFTIGNDTGLDATLTAMVGASAALDDVVGIQGNLTGVLHAGYHPEQHPVAELDAKVTWYLRACLICFGGAAVLQLNIVNGTLFDGVLVSYDKNPPPLPDPGPPSITTAALPSAYEQRPYSALLDAGGRDGTWTLSDGSLPAGLTLAPDGTVSGTPSGTAGVYPFAVTFTDSEQRSTSARVVIDLTFAGPPPTPPTPVTHTDITAISPNPATTHEAIQLSAFTTGSPLPVNDTLFFCYVSATNDHLCNSEHQSNFLCAAFVGSDARSDCEMTVTEPGTYRLYATLNRFDDSDAQATKMTLTVTG